MAPGSRLHMLCSLSQCHCLGFMNFACPKFIYLLSSRIPKESGFKVLCKSSSGGKGRIHNGTLEAYLMNKEKNYV